jgi:acyl carrier protein
MNRQQISARLRVLLILELGITATHARHLKEDTEFAKDLGADSLDMVQLPAAIENEFEIRISEAEAEFCETVGTAIDLIESKLENKRRAA